MYAEIEKETVLADLVEIWHELGGGDPDSLDRYEITEHGEIIVSPLPANRHQLVIAAVTEQLLTQLGRWVLSEPSVLTRTAGIRCPDVAWLPEHRTDEALADGPMAVVPPLVVEVLSPGNRNGEMAHKIRGYLGSGAEEVIVVGLDGKITFHTKGGVSDESATGVTLDLPRQLFE